MFDAVLQQWQREYRAVEVEGDGGVIGDDVGGVVSGCHGKHLIMDGVVVEKREKQLNERESSSEMQKGKMGYLRHSCPIRVRDCVVRTLGLLVVVARRQHIRPLPSGVQTRGAN